MGFKTLPASWSRPHAVEDDQAVAPAGRQHCGFQTYALRVEAIGLMKLGAFTEVAVDEVGLVLVAVERGNVDSIERIAAAGSRRSFHLPNTDWLPITRRSAESPPVVSERLEHGMALILG